MSTDAPLFEGLGLTPMEILWVLNEKPFRAGVALWRLSYTVTPNLHNHKEQQQTVC